MDKNFKKMDGTEMEDVGGGLILRVGWNNGFKNIYRYYVPDLENDCVRVFPSEVKAKDFAEKQNLTGLMEDCDSDKEAINDIKVFLNATRTSSEDASDNSELF